MSRYISSRQLSRGLSSSPEGQSKRRLIGRTRGPKNGRKRPGVVHLPSSVVELLKAHREDSTFDREHDGAARTTTAYIRVYARREAKAGKATELLASQFVTVLADESVVEEQELFFGDGS